MTALAGAGFHAIALDLPPFGYSHRPVGGTYNRQTQATRILGVIESLQIRRAVLVGHSFGAGATAEAAVRASDTLAGLVLVDAALAPQSLDQPSQDSPLLTAALALPPLRYALTATLATNPLLTHRFLTTFVRDPAVLTDARVRLYQRPLSVSGTTPAVATWLPELFLTDTAAATHTRAAFATLRAPTLLIWGEDDTVTPLSDGTYLASLVPGAQLAVLPRVGHIPQIEDPPAFNRALLQFLTAHRASL
jgi:pimeloyl-ACP methyl ester carboxylesterase